VAASPPWPAGPADPADPEADPEAVARLICLRLLTTAPRTRAELASALRRRGVPAAAAEAVLSRFTDVKLIDDALFATAWVESRHHGRGLAGRVLATELRHRGVPAEHIRAAVSELGPDQEAATARALVDQRLASTRGKPAATRVRRLVGLLARKGYPQALAYRVVREALEQDGLDPAAEGIDLSDADEPGGEDESSGW
jgi:regulatory protein